MGSPVAATLRAPALSEPVLFGNPRVACRSVTLRCSATKPQLSATVRPSTVAIAAPRTPRSNPRMNKGSSPRISPFARIASFIGVRVSPAPLRIPSTTFVAKNTVIPGKAIEK